MSTEAARAVLPAPQTTNARCDTARMLDRIRTAAMESRLAPRETSDRVAARLQALSEAELDILAEGLVRVLPDALGRRVVMHRPGTASLSFDEAWLMRMIGASAESDDDGLHFAIASRVRRDMRRPVRFLAGQVARHLDRAAPGATSTPG